MSFIVAYGWIEGNGREIEFEREFDTIEQADAHYFEQQPFVELHNGWIEEPQ